MHTCEKRHSEEANKEKSVGAKIDVGGLDLKILECLKTQKLKRGILVVKEN